MEIRVMLEKREEDYLSNKAMLAKNSAGRRVYEKKCPMRTDFQRDRDRILHSKAFRRLKHKTQVFISPTGDHYRTRLTHTLEVAQISRTIARALRLNEDLVEAIALGHDLGHTPFGHIGEKALDEISHVGFSHNIQSLRIVDKLEKTNKRQGLNLTYEVRDGILNHSGGMQAKTYEARLVNLCDRIAYINHDIDDSIRAGIISSEDLPKEVTSLFGATNGERINTMVRDVIESTLRTGDISMSEKIRKNTDDLRNFMFEEVYENSKVKAEASKAFYIINELYKYFIDNPTKMGLNLEATGSDEDLERSVCDYIAGMTDRYVMYIFQEVFLPKSWDII